MWTRLNKLTPVTNALALLAAFVVLTAAGTSPVRAQAQQTAFNALQQDALKRGCKKFYDEYKQRDEYNLCTIGRSGRTKDSLIDGCYALFHQNNKDLKTCLGKYAKDIRDL